MTLQFLPIHVEENSRQLRRSSPTLTVLVDKTRVRTSLVYIFSKLIFDSGEAAARNTRADMHRTTETAQKNLEIISTILQHSNLPPFTELLEKVDTFNAAVSRSASFLAEKIIYKASEAFDEEIETSMEDVKEIIGGRLSKMLAAQVHNSGSSTSKPRRPFVRIIFQIFILNFCVSEIDPCSVISIKDVGKFISHRFLRLWLTKLQFNPTYPVGNTIQYSLRHRQGPSKHSNRLW